MATLFTRLHRMGASGYDKIYLETSSKVVVRPTGHSVEDDLSTIELKLEKLSASVVTSTVPEQLKAGSVAVVGDDIYIGNASGVPVKVSGNTTGFSIETV